MAFNLCRAISHSISGGNKRYSMHCSRKASCKKLQKGLDFCLEQTVTAPVPVQRQRLFRILLRPAIPPVRGFNGDGARRPSLPFKGSRQCLSKKHHRARLPIPIGRQGRALSLGRVGARHLAKSPRFSEPIGKKGVHKDGQHSMAAAILIMGASRGLGFDLPVNTWLTDGAYLPRAAARPPPQSFNVWRKTQRACLRSLQWM